MAHEPLQEIRNPATGEPIATVTLHTIDDLHAAIERAREAQAAWAARTVRARGELLRKSSQYIYEHMDDLAELISSCTGKSRIDSLSGEIVPSAIAVRHYVRRGSRLLRTERVKRSSLLFLNKRSTIERVPLGVIGIISPWNYPWGIPMHDIAAALIAGNGVILKVATQAQPIGDEIVKMLQWCGLPDGLISAVHLPGKVAGPALVASRIDKLFFTGSTAVGRELAVAAGERLLPISLELGGNDAMLVLDDANLERAVGGAIWGGCTNNGQSCGGVERVFVAESVYDEFVEKLASRTARLRHGIAGDIDLGALTTEKQLTTVREHFRDAVEKGARVVAQSAPVSEGLPDQVHPAVILVDVTDEMLVMREETFGPVLAVMKVADADEAVRRANDSQYGLSASVWCNDDDLAREIALRLNVGVVMANDHLMCHGMSEVPWGGMNDSGVGRSHGDIGILEMTEARTVVYERWKWLASDFWWHPYGELVRTGLRGAMAFLFGRGVGRFLGLVALLRTFIRRARRG